jgi:predicted Rdx family selenoprotein
MKTKSRIEMGYCPYCKRYIGSGYIALEHKKLCKSVSPEVREIHSGIKQ